MVYRVATRAIFAAGVAFFVLALLFLTQGQWKVAAHDDPSDCTTSGLNTTFTATPSGPVQHGDLITYSATFSNAGATACNITDLDASLTLPNGTVITLLTDQTLNLGDSINCPGDPKCSSPGPYTYTVAHANETGPITNACPPVPTGGDFPRRVTAYIQADGTLHSTEGDDEATDCKTLSRIVKHTPTVTTEVHNANHTDITNQTVNPGTSVHDKAILTADFGTPTGTVDFKRYSTNNCTGASVDQNNVALNSGTAESNSFSTVPVALSYLVHYDGDANFNATNGECEPLNVNKYAPDVKTEVHNSAHTDITNSSVPVGTVIHDKAIVSGAGPTPTGTVDFKRYSTNNCTGSSVDQNNVALASGSAESNTFTTVAGALSYSVHYDGDSNYAEVTATCEPLTVNKINPTVRTEVHNPNHTDITNTEVAPGTIVHDKAFVTGSGGTPTGTVDFKRYSTNNCTGASVDQNDVPLNSGTAESSNFTTVAGALSYLVHFDGNGTYNTANGPCEPLTVKEPPKEGCTPGYWKQSQHFDSWTAPYDPTDKFADIFSRTITIKTGNKNVTNPTLLQALQAQGGGINALVRHAVAALLNAASGGVDYPLTTAQVISQTQAAIDNPSTIEAAKNNFAGLNEQECPLN